MEGLSISINNAITGDNDKSLGAQMFEKYKERVEASGGTVENDSCTIRFLESLNLSGTPATNIFEDYRLRVLAAGGTIENESCTINFINTII